MELLFLYIGNIINEVLYRYLNKNINQNFIIIQTSENRNCHD